MSYLGVMEAMKLLLSDKKPKSPLPPDTRAIETELESQSEAQNKETFYLKEIEKAGSVEENKKHLFPRYRSELTIPALLNGLSYKG